MSEKHTHEHCGHCHEHTHADGTVHSHSHATASSPEEALALLKYMAGHNKHHAEELHELAHGFDDLAAELIHGAVIDMEAANAKLDQALSMLQSETGKEG